MYRFELDGETWASIADGIPDGTTSEGATIFDGAGHLWYHGPDGDLVRFSFDGDVVTQSFPHPDFPYFDVSAMDETRMAYDPVHDRIALAGYGADHFLIFDIATSEFSEGSVSPGGVILDNSCQDRSGGIYTGSAGYDTMYRYDIGADTWTPLPTVPTNHDNNSNCVVSGDGYLYFATAESGATELFRLPLGKK
jgi:hypothetical protein